MPIETTPKPAAAAWPLTLLPEDELRILLSESRAGSVPRGQRLAEPGFRPSELLIVERGSLRKRGERGPAEAVEAGGVVGLAALLTAAPYTFSLWAGEDSDVRAIPWSRLRAAFDRVPGLLRHLQLVSDSAPLRELDLCLEEMGASTAFRAAFLAGLERCSAPADTWLASAEAPIEFSFLPILGAVQAAAPVEDAAGKPLWIAPNGVWQLFEACLSGEPAGVHLKAATAVDLYKAGRPLLESLRARFPGDFERLARLAARAPVETEEADEGDSPVENLEELFPAAPRFVSALRLSYPVVLQNDEMDCGPACLAMVSKFHGNDLTLPFWRARLRVDRDGASLFDLAAAAEQAGFVSHGLRVDDLCSVESDLFPLIALRRYHFVVVYKADKKGALVGDPGAGLRMIDWREFNEGFDGTVLMLRPTESFYHEEAPPSGFRHYFEMFRGLGLELWLILAASAVLSALSLAPALLSQFVLDQVLVKRDETLLLIALSAGISCAAMTAAAGWLRQYYTAFVTARFDFASLSAFMRKLLSLPYDFFATRHVGDFTRRLDELQRVRQFVLGQLIETSLHFVNIAVYGGVLFLYSPTVAATLLTAAPSVLVLSVAFSGRLRLHYNEFFAREADQSGLVADLIKGVATVKSLAAEVAARWRFEELTVRSLRAQNRFLLTAAALNGLSSFTRDLVRYGTVGLAGWLAIRGRMTPGQVVAVAALAAGVIEPFSGLACVWAEIQHVRTVLDRLNDVFLAPSERKPAGRALTKNRLRGDLEFRDVWFRYGGESSEWILKGLSFRVLPGQSVAVVGPSGAGKSTLALLAAGLYEPTKGTILVDGRDYREYDKQWLRQQVGLLLQENVLFQGSLLENIALADPRPDVARVEAAAELADAKRFILEKPGGFDYTITHGGLGLSGGQKQRIAIARVLYADPALLFLDEATSFLDAQSERVISLALKMGRKDRTVISIAHRYATVKMSDIALVIDDGRVVEYGTHSRLLKLGGRYAKLFGDQIA